MKPQAQMLSSLVVAFAAVLLLAGPAALAAGDPDKDPPLAPLPPSPASEGGGVEVIDVIWLPMRLTSTLQRTCNVQHSVSAS